MFMVSAAAATVMATMLDEDQVAPEFLFAGTPQ